MEALQNYHRYFLCYLVTWCTSGMYESTNSSFFIGQQSNSLTHHPTTHKPYNDNLCVIRALAVHQLKGYNKTHLEDTTQRIFIQFMQKVGDIDPATFRGVKEEQFPILKKNYRVHYCFVFGRLRK